MNPPMIKKALGKGKVSRVKIQYTPVGEKIIISTHKPGLVIGRKGEKIEELTLYTLEQQEEVEDLKRRNARLEARLAALEVIR